MTTQCHSQITLRAIEPEDLDLLYKIENDPQLWALGPTNVPYSRYALHNYIAQSTCDIYKDCQVRMMIDDASGQTVGIVDIVNFDPANRRAEVGILIIRQFRRMGYATAALSAIATYALKVLHLHQLFAYVHVDNKASLQLFRKAGYQQTSLLHDWLYDGTTYRDAYLLQLVF